MSLLLHCLALEEEGASEVEEPEAEAVVNTEAEEEITTDL